MKKTHCHLLLLALSLTLLCSCNNNGLKGKSYYLLTGNVNYNNSYASLKEMKLDFIANDKVESKMTLYADAFGYRIINDTSAEAESKIYSYKYENGILELSDLHVMAKLEFLSNGDIKTNEGEYFYTNSIVDLLGTEKAYERIREDSKSNLASIFKSFIDRPAKPLIRYENGKIILNDNNQTDSTDIEKLRTEYNELLAEVDSFIEDGTQFQGELAEIFGEIKQLREQAKTNLKLNANTNKIKESLNKLRSKINQFNLYIQKLKNENDQLSKMNQEYSNGKGE